jgi:hypothetical protein
MRKILPLLLVFSMLVSCGPHRMGCGARGICENPAKQALEKIEKTTPIKV